MAGLAVPVAGARLSAVTFSQIALRCSSLSAGPSAMIGVLSKRSFSSENLAGVVSVLAGAPGTVRLPFTNILGGGEGGIFRGARAVWRAALGAPPPLAFFFGIPD